MKRALSLILAVALVLALAPVTALATSEAYGNEVWLQDTALHDGVTLSDNIYWSTYYSQLRHEYYITYTPGQQVMAVASYGNSVCDRLTASTAVKEYEAQGYRVVGSLENTDRIMRDTFWVGVYPGMTDEKIDYMAKVIKEAVR